MHAGSKAGRLAVGWQSCSGQLIANAWMTHRRSSRSTYTVDISMSHHIALSPVSPQVLIPTLIGARVGSLSSASESELSAARADPKLNSKRCSECAASTCIQYNQQDDNAFGNRDAPWIGDNSWEIAGDGILCKFYA